MSLPADTIKKWKGVIEGLNAKINEYENQIKEQAEQISQLKCDNQKLKNMIQKLKKQISQEEGIRIQQQQANPSQQIIEQLNNEIQLLQKQKTDEKKQISELQKQFLLANKNTNSFTNKEQKKIEQNNVEVKTKDRKISLAQIQEIQNEEDEQEKQVRQVEQFLSGISSQVTKKSVANLSQSFVGKNISQTQQQINPQYQQIYQKPKTIGENILELFETFYIFGVDKDIVFQLNNEEITFQYPKVLYKYYKASAHQNQVEMKNLLQAELFILNQGFPFGFKAKKYSEEDFGDIHNEILFCKFNHCLKDRFFTFNASGKDFLQTSYNNFGILNAINPNRQLFGYCLVLDDYFVEKNPSCKYYWLFQKTLCFTTYFPISDIFERLLMGIAEIMKILRIDFDRNLPKKQEKLDGIKIIEKTKEILSTTLDNLSLIHRIDERYSKLEIDIQKILPKDYQKQFQFELIKYSIPQKDLIFRESRKSLVQLILDTFSHEKFVTIYSQILREKKIIFFCENVYYLTRIVQFFQNIIHPLIWVNPIIFSASEYAISFGDLELPYIMGINSSEANFRNKRLKSFEAGGIFFVDIKLVKINQQQRFKCDEFSIGEGSDNYKPSELNIQNYFKLEPKNDDVFIRFQETLEMFMKTEIVNGIFPQFDDSYFQQGQFNEELFNHRVEQKLNLLNIPGPKRAFLQQISLTRYFQEYAKSKFGKQF